MTVSEQNSDAAVSTKSTTDNSAADAVTKASSEEGAEVKAGETGQEGQPSDSSTEDSSKGSAKERIEELNGKYRAAERDAEYWKSRAEEAEKLIPRKEPEIKLEKSLEDFEGDEAAFTKYVADETMKAANAANEENAEIDQQNRLNREYFERENNFAKNLSDYDEVTRREGLTITPEMKNYIMGDENGPELLYFLGKNPDVAAKVADLPPMQVAPELARLQVRELSKPATTDTETPEPGARLKGQEHATAIDVHSPDSDKLPMDEWAKRWKKKETARLS